MPLRQAGAIYLKNLITNSWQDHELEPGQVNLVFSIHEQDRAMVRDTIVEAIVHAPDIIRVQCKLISKDYIKAFTFKIRLNWLKPDFSGFFGHFVNFINN